MKNMATKDLEEKDPFQYAVLTTVLNREKQIEYPDEEMEENKEYIIEDVVELMFGFKDAEKSLAKIEIYAKEPQRALKGVADYINGSSLVKIIRNKGQEIILTDIIETVCNTMMTLSKAVGNCRIV